MAMKMKKPRPAPSTSTKAAPQGGQTESPKASNDVFVCSHLHKAVLFEMPDGRQVRLSGINDHLKGKAKGIIDTGGGIYTKIAATDWGFIAKTFADWPALKNGLIYAAQNPRTAKAMIREREELRDGFEPIDPTKTRTTASKGA